MSNKFIIFLYSIIIYKCIYREREKEREKEKEREREREREKFAKICCPFGISTDFLSVCEAASGLICDTVLIILSEVLLPIESMVGSLMEAQGRRG